MPSIAPMLEVAGKAVRWGGISYSLNPTLASINGAIQISGKIKTEQPSGPDMATYFLAHQKTQGQGDGRISEQDALSILAGLPKDAHGQILAPHKAALKLAAHFLHVSAPAKEVLHKAIYG